MRKQVSDRMTTVYMTTKWKRCMAVIVGLMVVSSVCGCADGV